MVALCYRIWDEHQHCRSTCSRLYIGERFHSNVKSSPRKGFNRALNKVKTSNVTVFERVSRTSVVSKQGAGLVIKRSPV